MHVLSDYYTITPATRACHHATINTDSAATSGENDTGTHQHYYDTIIHHFKVKMCDTLWDYW